VNQESVNQVISVTHADIRARGRGAPS
jgi:hypothetical protein